MESNKDKKNKIEKEFLEAYDRLSEPIFRHIYYRVSDSEKAQDLLSETFMKTWKYLSEGGQIDSLKSFLYRVANNLIIDFYRQKSRTDLPLDEAIAIPDAESENPQDRVDRHLNAGILERALAGLPENYRSILVFRYLDEMSIAEIAKATGKSRTNIYVTIHRGLKELKARMLPRGDPKKW